MEYEFVKLKVENRICTISVNRPPVNAINAQTYRELTDAFTSINFRSDISVVVFHGEGRGFIAGNDINDIKTMTKRESPCLSGRALWLRAQCDEVQISGDWRNTQICAGRWIGVRICL